ncbi:arabinoxylan arabinofuranohydrolase [Microdochium nivale]|nr:arabinoxylan arabinofuranohydrolase [Microdochium nivale]
MQAVIGFTTPNTPWSTAGFPPLGDSPQQAVIAMPPSLPPPRTTTTIAAAAVGNLDYTTSEAGNPFAAGWYADPDAAFYEGEYWVFPTSSLPYEEQTYLDAFSSPDLVRWTKHPRVLTTADIPWAHKAVWAPAPIARNGRYYLYFGANDIQRGEIAEGAVGGIGVAVADRPGGPYKDALGRPLVGDFHNGAQPIDQAVFIDHAGTGGAGGEGQAYMYYGGHGHANVVKLNEDMISLGYFDDNEDDDGGGGGVGGNGTANADGGSSGSKKEVFREITPANYTEGSLLFVRRGVYYYMWSEGDWTGPDYSVSYAMSRSSPVGPFTLPDGGGGGGGVGGAGERILQQDLAVARGSGHNGVINVPGTDTWYMVYHRRPLSETDGNHRVVCYDRMYFDDSDEGKGRILPVQMLVKDNFADGAMIAWKTLDSDSGGDGDGGVAGAGGKGKGTWEVVEQRLVGGSDVSGAVTMAMLDTNFADVVFDAAVGFPPTTSNTGRHEDGNDNDEWSAQLIFRAKGNAREGYSRYTAAALRPVDTGTGETGVIVWIYSYVNGTTTVLAENTTVLATVEGSESNAGKDIRLRVTAVGDQVTASIRTGGGDAPGYGTGTEQGALVVSVAVDGQLCESGANGVAVEGKVQGVRFGNISVAHAPPPPLQSQER